MNYVFPELAHYKREWIPLLTPAKDLIERDGVRFLCNAVYFVAQRLDRNLPETCEAQYAAQAEELVSTIEAAIQGYGSVMQWLQANHPVQTLQKAYRLAWIDHIIKECKE